MICLDVEVECDACGGVSCRSAEHIPNPLEFLKAGLRSEGWRFVDGGDYCPSCVADANQANADHRRDETGKGRKSTLPTFSAIAGMILPKKGR